MLKAKRVELSKRQAGLKILESRLTLIERAMIHFDNSAQGYKLDEEFDEYLEEMNPEFNEQCREHFGICMGTVLREATSESNYDMHYGEFVGSLPHERFDAYNRLRSTHKLIEERISDRIDQIDDLEADIDDLEESLLSYLQNN